MSIYGTINKEKCFWLVLGLIIGWSFCAFVVDAIDPVREATRRGIVEFDTIACSKLAIVDDEGKPIITMGKLVNGTGGFINITDVNEDKHLALTNRQLTLYNEEKHKVAVLGCFEEGGLFYMKNKNNAPTHIVAANEKTPILQPSDDSQDSPP